MSNIVIRDANGADQELATGSGSGSSGSPFYSPLSTAVGLQADAAASTDTGTATLMALVKRLLSRLSGELDGDYETVAAGSTDQVLGATGAIGDYLAGLLIVPATTGAGNVSIKDGGGSAISVFVSGTLADLTPIWLPLGMRATGAGWKITTGSNVSCIGVGNFT